MVSCKKLEYLFFRTKCRSDQIWSAVYGNRHRPLERDVSYLKSVHRLATRLVKGQTGRSRTRRLKYRNLRSSTEHRFRGDMTDAFKTLEGLAWVDPDSMFGQASKDRTRNNFANRWQSRSRLNVPANASYNRVVVA